MKTLKPKLFILSLVFLLLNSCVVKSLHPFYTKSTIFFEKKFIGTWEDTENAKWEVLLFQEVILKENKKNKPTELDDDQLRIYNKYKNGYVVYFEKDNTKSSFLAMPFKINNQLFLDFTPIEDKEIDDLKNDLYKIHLIGTHTLAKVDINSNNDISINWFSSKKLEELLNEDKIKIKHEKVGFSETVLLTASTEELEKFIKKYMDSKDEDKWKTDVEFNLKRVNETSKTNFDKQRND
ncbi:MAG: hypothetical protein CVU08_10020 [Bacteroidetes bacterium HGW-Bacteroidetes-3]|nr:MAG: hypothetical protein CVU08_10020 [Bacteroidetes bacterium HGW-Bacteroidetes-3]